MKHDDLKGIPISTSLEAALEEDSKPAKALDAMRVGTISAYAFFIAAITSVVARLLIYLIDFCTNISFYGIASFNPASPTGHSLGLFVILIPVAGGIIVGLMAFYGSKAIRGHGIPEAMEQILTNQSKIRPSITFLKPVSAALSIGTGGPFGAEGPIIATGGALGSSIGQLLRISNNERKILLASGATAGMSAIFGSPVAAIFLAIELLLFEFSPRSLIPVAIACVTGAAGHQLLFGHDPFFQMPLVAMPGNAALFAYTTMGVLIGVLSVLVTKSVYLIEDGFEKLPIHWMWWPALGGLVVGIVGYVAPLTLGVGYSNITDLLAGTPALQVVLSLCFLKFISWSVALGSGTSGGTLAPLLTIGGACGSLLGTLVVIAFPEAGVTLPLAALVGMAAMFAGASRALLTSIIFALETTSQAHALLPLLGASVAAYGISYFLMETTIMTEKIARRGVKTPHSYETDILETITAQEVVSRVAHVFYEQSTIKNFQEWVNANKENLTNYLIIVDEQNHFKGIVNASVLYRHFDSPAVQVGSFIQKSGASLHRTSTLRHAIDVMAREHLDVVPVISEDNRLLGIVSYHDILSAYRQSSGNHETNKPHLSVRRGWERFMKKEK